ncbi:MAG: chemotaxis-specific protein-glutamate methyltransferase CheB [Planctomycetia bacterium]|nr:chemotaxis-specific protein-glutamate methyltransferase CheB [Planctomycetia bacterium]
MTSKNIRVLVVDDSAVIRAMICDHIAASPGLEVAGTASDGRRAVEVFCSSQPDVVTLDVQMPGMDGLATLDAILAERPVPVVMVSSLTQRGGEITFEALDRGAIEYVAKPVRGADAAEVLGTELVRKIRMVAGTDVRRILEIRRERKQRRSHRAGPTKTPKHIPDACPGQWADKCIAIGISTGGPPALSSLFQTLRPPMPPIVVVQHMPPHFTRPLAWRLDALSALSIAEATRGDVPRPNGVLIAPGGIHLSLRRHGREAKVMFRDGPVVSGHKPSIDVMMKSVAELFPGGCLGIIMTGMGRDGADGCRAIREAGGYVLGQDEASSDVYGMNKVAYVEGNVDQQFALRDAATIITRQVKRLWAPVGGAIL